jgi:large subunit ribosomal protein L5
MQTLKERYKQTVAKELKELFDIKNINSVPSLKKIVIAMGVRDAVKDKNVLQDCIEELKMISGQKPILTKAKKAISNFKLREGQEIGLKVTLRGRRMWDFMERFCHLASPRIRDFRGFNRKCDGRGNYTLGVDDQQIFPEVNLDKVKRQQGMHITFVTTAQTDKACVQLLEKLGLPFKSSEEA